MLNEIQEPKGLIGKSRATAILLNACIPFLAAAGETRLFKEGLLLELPKEESNQVLRETAHSLFGPDHSEKLYPHGIHRQGLLQVFQDYGMTERPE